MYTHYDYHAQLESCAGENFELVSNSHLFSIVISQYWELIPLYSTDDAHSGYHGDSSSNAPSIESVTSQYSTYDGCSGYQGDISSGASLVGPVLVMGFAGNMPFCHIPHPSDGATLLGVGGL